MGEILRPPAIIVESIDQQNGAAIGKSIVRSMRKDIKRLLRNFAPDNNDLGCAFRVDGNRFSIRLGARTTSFRGTSYLALGFESPSLDRHLLIPEGGKPVMREGKIDSVMFPNEVSGSHASLAELRDFYSLLHMVRKTVASKEPEESMV